MRGQAALELLLTVGVVLAFTIPVLFLLFSITQIGYENAAAAQADASARSLAETMNLVYAEGIGAKRALLMNVPSSTKKISVENGEVVVSIQLSTGTYDGTSNTFANVSETVKPITNKKGLFPLDVYTNNKGQVEYSERTTK